MKRLDLPFPDMGESALYGIVGECARKLSDYTEASAASIYMNLLMGLGSIIGRGLYFSTGVEKHHANLYLGIVGESGASRKGGGWHAAE